MAREGDYPTTFIPGALKAGMTPTAGLRAFRQAGGRITTSVWYRSWGQVAAALSKQGDLAALPLNRRPERAMISEWEAKPAGMKLYQGEALIRFRGTDIVATRAISVRTKDWISVGRAIDQMADLMVEGEDQYQEIVLGVTLTGVYEFTG